MEKVLKIAFIEIFSRQKPLNKNPTDPQPRFMCLSLTDFPKFLKNIIFPTFLLNTLCLYMYTNLLLFWYLWLIFVQHFLCTSLFMHLPILKIAFIEIFSRQKPLNKNPTDPQPCFMCLNLTDFPKFFKNIIFLTFLLNTVCLYMYTNLLLFWYLWLIFVQHFLCTSHFWHTHFQSVIHGFSTVMSSCPGFLSMHFCWGLFLN